MCVCVHMLHLTMIISIIFPILIESSPEPQCGAIIEKYKDRFLSYIDAHAIATRLKIEGVIPDTMSHEIQQSAPSVANEALFVHLQSHSSLETLHKLCDVMISTSGYPNMNELGRLMKDALTTVSNVAEIVYKVEQYIHYNHVCVYVYEVDQYIQHIHVLCVHVYVQTSTFIKYMYLQTGRFMICCLSENTIS